MQPWFPIETERLSLREFRLSDEPDIHDYASDPEVVRFTQWGPNTRDATRLVLRSWLKEQELGVESTVTLAIELKSEQRLIGAIRLSVKDERNRTADFGYTLNRRYWGHGYATEAARAILNTGFRQLGIHRMFATCDTRNLASFRVLEKLGMRREGTFEKDVIQKGQWRDSYLYAILADEWIAREEVRTASAEAFESRAAGMRR
jgi:[ribosomal protein S5]-alanine N-acetyltransferase